MSARREKIQLFTMQDGRGKNTYCARFAPFGASNTSPINHQRNSLGELYANGNMASIYNHLEGQCEVVGEIPQEYRHLINRPVGTAVFLPTDEEVKKFREYLEKGLKQQLDEEKRLEMLFT